MAELIIVLGPTAVGKTDYSIDLALRYASPVISCDSRQIYREMKIGTAPPSDEQLARVRHYFIGTRSVTDPPYTAGRYELDALALLEELFREHDTLVMAGGSGLYIDALCNGLDDFPDVDPSVRESLMERLEKEGLEALRFELRRLDPETFESIDTANRQRVVRALEVCIGTGRPFSSFKTSAGSASKTLEGSAFKTSKGSAFEASAGLSSKVSAGSALETSAGSSSTASVGSMFETSAGSSSKVLAGSAFTASAGSAFETSAGSSSKASVGSTFKTSAGKTRPFTIRKIGLTRPREELYDRINRRVDLMMEAGLEAEARSLLQYRDLPALNTVGYRELFGYFDGKYPLEEAVRLIKRNTRHYAKKQLPYWGRDNSIEWITL